MGEEYLIELWMVDLLQIQASERRLFLRSPVKSLMKADLVESTWYWIQRPVGEAAARGPVGAVGNEGYVGTGSPGQGWWVK